MIVFDYSKLRGKIKEKFDNEYNFAKYINKSNGTLSAKLNNKAEWAQNEIYESAEALGIEPHEIPIYFFNEKVQEIEQTEKGQPRTC